MFKLFFALKYIELAKWKLFLNLTILPPKMTKILKRGILICVIQHTKHQAGTCNLCGQASRAFRGVIM